MTSRTHDDLVTGEAVALVLPVAGPAIRMLSGIIDVVLAIALLVVSTIALVRYSAGLDEPLQMSFTLLLTIAVLVALPTTCETLTGRTLGKKITGLRVVRDDGGAIDLRRAFMRHLVGVVEIYLLSGTPALVTALLTNPTRRLGDIAAGTYVVRNRVTLPRPMPRTMSPSLASWAAGADIGRLPDRLAMRVRSTLHEGARFTGPAQERVYGSLASQVSEFVSPAPPAGTPALTYLIAVLDERRRRETARLEAQRVRHQRLFSDR